MGWRCLDLGCGPDGIVELLSVRAGATGPFVGFDADPVFLEHARALARDRGLDNVGFVQGDAYCTGLRERRVLEFRSPSNADSTSGRVEPEAMWTSTRIESMVPREEVRDHGAIQVREVCEDVFHSWKLLRGAHEGGQVIG